MLRNILFIFLVVFYSFSGSYLFASTPPDTLKQLSHFAIPAGESLTEAYFLTNLKQNGVVLLSVVPLKGKGNFSTWNLFHLDTNLQVVNQASTNLDEKLRFAGVYSSFNNKYYFVLKEKDKNIWVVEWDFTSNQLTPIPIILPISSTIDDFEVLADDAYIFATYQSGMPVVMHINLVDRQTRIIQSSADEGTALRPVFKDDLTRQMYFSHNVFRRPQKSLTIFGAGVSGHFENRIVVPHIDSMMANGRYVQRVVLARTDSNILAVGGYDDKSDVFFEGIAFFPNIDSMDRKYNLISFDNFTKYYDQFNPKLARRYNLRRSRRLQKQKTWQNRDQYVHHPVRVVADTIWVALEQFDSDYRQEAVPVPGLFSPSMLQPVFKGFSSRALLLIALDANGKPLWHSSFGAKSGVRSQIYPTIAFSCQDKMAGVFYFDDFTPTYEYEMLQSGIRKKIKGERLKAASEVSSNLVDSFFNAEHLTNNTFLVSGVERVNKSDNSISGARYQFFIRTYKPMPVEIIK